MVIRGKRKTVEKGRVPSIFSQHQNVELNSHALDIRNNNIVDQAWNCDAYSFECDDDDQQQPLLEAEYEQQAESHTNSE